MAFVHFKVYNLHINIKVKPQLSGNLCLGIRLWHHLYRCVWQWNVMVLRQTLMRHGVSLNALKLVPYSARTEEFVFSTCQEQEQFVLAKTFWFLRRKSSAELLGSPHRALLLQDRLPPISITTFVWTLGLIFANLSQRYQCLPLHVHNFWATFCHKWPMCVSFYACKDII